MSGVTLKIPDRKLTLAIKRFIDLTASLSLLVISLPLWPVIALGIKIDSKGPVFYTQKRVGRNDHVFSLIKFRSMIKRAEENGPVWAEENDKRVTPLGRILRALHMDELPQLLNVIKGDMSLVGPRPERPEFVKELEKQIPNYSLRHRAKPGITGWAQVNFPYASSFEDSKKKLEYDLFYVLKMNLFFDSKIIIRTIPRVFSGTKKPDSL